MPSWFVSGPDDDEDEDELAEDDEVRRVRLR